MKTALSVIRWIVGLNLLYGAIFYKLAGVPFSVSLFTTMSNAVHGLVSQPVFRIGTGIIETVCAILFLIPKTARTGARIIVIYMLGPIFSHLLVLGCDNWGFPIALATFLLPCFYLYSTRK